MNSILKRKCIKGSRTNSENCNTENQETKITTKGLQRIDNIVGRNMTWQNFIRIHKSKRHKNNVISKRKQQENSKIT